MQGAINTSRGLGRALEGASAAVLGLFAIHLLRVLLRPAWPSGILPRTARGLEGILFAPLLHGSWAHLFANALPLLILLALLLADRRYRPVPTLAWIWLASGAGTWLIGRGHAVHVGASGIIFGLAAFLIVAGWTMGNWRATLVAVVVGLLFGGMFHGVLPQAGPISWEGHLCGALAGAGLALRQTKGARRRA